MDKDITIYSTPSCHYCHAAKEFFAKHKIEVTDINVAEDAEGRQEMIELTKGQTSVPVIKVGKENVLVGFKEDKLKELLSLE